jgi:hypothetical protein
MNLIQRKDFDRTGDRGKSVRARLRTQQRDAGDAKHYYGKRTPHDTLT